MLFKGSKYKSLLIHQFLIATIFCQIAFPQDYGTKDKVVDIPLESSNLPIIVINTLGNTIIDEERIIAYMGIIFNGEGIRNYVTDNFNEYDGLVDIELRGSSSSAYPKQQFRFETVDSSWENLNISLCGLPKENDWILYGPYNDRSLIRNVYSYDLSNKLGRYASRTVYCEVILNDEYIGLYVLMETIKRDNDRIDISKLTPLENSGDELTGGYIIKIDKLDGENVDLWFSNYGTPYQYHYPKADEITEEQKLYIANYLNDFEELMNSENFNNPENGYNIFIDVSSFVDHFILNEFCKNVDAYRLSAFLHKDKNSVNPKLIAGPIWDFNLTFGDAWIEEEINISDGWQVDYSLLHPNDIFKVPFWWSKIARDYYFEDLLKTRWFTLRESVLSLDNIFKQIDSLTAYIRESRERNFLRWPEALTIPYDQEISRLKGWIIQRLNWIDNNLELLSNVNKFSSNNMNEQFELLQNYPNPFNPITTVKYRIPSNVDMRVRLSVFDMLGREVVLLVNEKQEPGLYEVDWNAEKMSSGVYVLNLKAFSSLSTNFIIQSRKMMLLK